MSGDGDSPPRLPPRPSLPPVRSTATAAELAEGRAKRLAYEAQRRRYTTAWHRRLAGLADEPEEEPGEGAGGADVVQTAQPDKRRTRAGGKVHDPRQGSFEV